MKQPEEIIRRWFDDVWNRRNAGAINELMARSAIGQMEGGRATRDQFRGFQQELCTAFPDLRLTIEQIARGDEDEFAVRWRFQGTHQGRGLDIKPTGNRIEFVGTTWLTVRDGLIQSGCDTWNQGYLMTRMGATDRVAPNVQFGADE